MAIGLITLKGGIIFVQSQLNSVAKLVARYATISSWFVQRLFCVTYIMQGKENKTAPECKHAT